jgi:hypothetical protein
MSGKKLIFYQGMAHWKCTYASWHEDREISQKALAKPSRPVYHGMNDFHKFAYWGDGSFVDFQALTDAFNTRQFTYDQDAGHAIAGILTTLSPIFRGGFLFGLPELYFDAALLWEPMPFSPVRRRNALFPSWSWLGWQGHVSVHRSHRRIDGPVILVTQ